MHTTRTEKWAPSSKIRTNLLVDIGLVLVFLFLYEPHATGISLHEWLGMVIGSVLMAHLLLHWQWIAAVSKRFFGKTSGQARLNYVLNMALFVTFNVALFSGLMVSESIVPLLGLQSVGGRFWHWLHGFAADMTFWLVAAHIALHWKWLANAFRQHILLPLQQRAGWQPKTSIAEIE